MTAFSLNMLPSSIYAYTYQLFSFGSPQSTYPYLTKFEGHWQADLTPVATQTAVAQCTFKSGVVIVHDGTLSGSVGTLNDYMSLSATIDPDGHLTGTTVRSGNGNDGSIEATIVTTHGQGSWTDAFGCQGTLSLKKVDPFEDPSKGSIVSYAGDVTLVRAGGSESPTPGQLLYVGDEIDVPSNGSAYLSIGLQTVNLMGGQTYKVTNQ